MMSLVPFALLGIAAGLVVDYATAWGPWAFSDATGYITAARNLVAGHGIGAFDPSGRFSPGVSHPPLYVLALGAVSLLGLDPLNAARILDVVLFGLLVGTSGLMLHRVLVSLWSGLSYSSLLLVHPAMLIAYTSAMAEPPFILLGLLALLLVTEHLQRPRPFSFLGAALCAAGALFSRYPGAAFVLSGALAVMLWGRHALLSRMVRAGIFLAIGSLPVGVFLVWATSRPEAEGPRAVSSGLTLLPALGRLGGGVAAVLWSWKPVPPEVLLPDWTTRALPTGLIAGVLAAAGLLALGTLVFNSARGFRLGGGSVEAWRPGRTLLQVFILFTGVYLALFAAAYLFTNPTPDVNSRTLLPLLPALLGGVVGYAHLTFATWRKSLPMRVGWVALLVLAIAGFSMISQDTVLGLHRTGLGYTGRQWRGSETIAAVRRLPPDLSLVSNEPAAVLLLVGRAAYPMPEIEELRPLERFEPFGTGSSPGEQAFREGKAVLVLFDTVEGQLRSLYGAGAQGRLAALLSGAVLQFRGQDGAIYLREDG
jgi:hypothetical protein